MLDLEVHRSCVKSRVRSQEMEALDGLWRHSGTLMEMDGEKLQWELLGLLVEEV